MANTVSDVRDVMPIGIVNQCMWIYIPNIEVTIKIPQFKFGFVIILDV